MVTMASRYPRILILLHIACAPSQEQATDTDTTGSLNYATEGPPEECPTDLEPLSTIEDYADALARARCAKTEACECTDVASDCVAQTTALLLLDFNEQIALGNVLDGTCARKRVLATEWAACELGLSSPCEGCEDFPGMVPSGGACEGDAGNSNCVAGHFCNGGVCEAYDGLAQLGAGEPCYDDGASKILGLCADGLLCGFSSDVCVAEPEIGDPCVDTYCGIAAWCDTSDVATGVCKARRPGGAACASSVQCASFRCVQSVCSDELLVCLLY